MDIFSKLVMPEIRHFIEKKDKKSLDAIITEFHPHDIALTGADITPGTRHEVCTGDLDSVPRQLFFHIRHARSPLTLIYSSTSFAPP